MPKKHSHIRYCRTDTRCWHHYTITVQGISNDDRYRSLSPVTPLVSLLFLSFLIPWNVLLSNYTGQVPSLYNEQSIYLRKWVEFATTCSTMIQPSLLLRVNCMQVIMNILCSFSLTQQTIPCTNPSPLSLRIWRSKSTGHLSSDVDMDPFHENGAWMHLYIFWTKLNSKTMCRFVLHLPSFHLPAFSFQPLNYSVDPLENCKPFKWNVDYCIHAVSIRDKAWQLSRGCTYQVHHAPDSLVFSFLKNFLVTGSKYIAPHSSYFKLHCIQGTCDTHHIRHHLPWLACLS